MENTTKRIKIIVTACKTREGKDFNSYRAVQKDGKLIDCRFKKCAGVTPEHTGFIDVKVSDISIDKTHEYPRVWIAAYAVVPEAEPHAVLDDAKMPF